MGFFTLFIQYFRYKKPTQGKNPMWGKIEMEVTFIKYTANYLCARHKQFAVYFINGTYVSIFPHIAILDFFSCVGYLHPKDYIKSVKNPFLNLEVNDLNHTLAN